jgi:hypothetical protein
VYRNNFLGFRTSDEYWGRGFFGMFRDKWGVEYSK